MSRARRSLRSSSNKLRGGLKGRGRKRRPASGDRRKAMLQGHRCPHRRARRSRKTSASSSENVHALPCSARPKKVDDRQGKTPRSSNGAGQEGRHRGAAFNQLKAQIEETTSRLRPRRSCKERLAKLAGGGRGGSASVAPLRSRSRSARTASTMPCMRPRARGRGRHPAGRRPCAAARDRGCSEKLAHPQ